MNWLRALWARLFSRNVSAWDSLNYGKPSTAGDEFRKNNEV